MNDDAIVRLRAMEPEDLDFLYAMENDKEVWDVGCTNVPYSRYVLHDYIANASNDIYADGQVRMVMEDRSGNRVGLVDVFNFDASNRRAEVSVVVMTEYRGRGLARDAVRQVCHYALRTLHLHQLYAIIATDNMASQQLFSETGFTGRNVLKEWLFDGLTYKDAIVMQNFFLKKELKSFGVSEKISTFALAKKMTR